MRVAIVTGASSGMGRDFARILPHFYKNLDEIWLVARSTEKLKKLRKQIEAKSHTKVRILDGDLSSDAVYMRIQKKLGKKQPDIRMLVNAAGFGKIGTYEELDKSTQEEMIDVNCKALTKMTGLCLPYLSKGSRIINVASAAAFAPQPGFTVYAATKSYVLSFSQGLSVELKKRGIIVTAVCPGPVDTPFFDVAGESSGTLKSMVKATSKEVVCQALKDSKKGRRISIYGNAMKAGKVLAKMMPDSLVLWFMNRV